LKLHIMKNLIEIAESKLSSYQDLPFAIYSCKKQQNLRSVPILKPVLVLVLRGEKKVGGKMDSTCLDLAMVCICCKQQPFL